MDHASRRQFLKGTAATVAATCIGVSKAVPATPFVKTINHGQFSISVLSDGHLTVPTRFLARNASEPDIKTAIAITADVVTPPCNITLVQSPRETILIDVGQGSRHRNGVGPMSADHLHSQLRSGQR